MQLAKQPQHVKNIKPENTGLNSWLPAKPTQTNYLTAAWYTKVIMQKCNVLSSRKPSASKHWLIHLLEYLKNKKKRRSVFHSRW